MMRPPACWRLDPARCLLARSNLLGLPAWLAASGHCLGVTDGAPLSVSNSRRARWGSHERERGRTHHTQRCRQDAVNFVCIVVVDDRGGCAGAVLWRWWGQAARWCTQNVREGVREQGIDRLRGRLAYNRTAPRVGLCLAWSDRCPGELAFGGGSRTTTVPLPCGGGPSHLGGLKAPQPR
jgi:hypothetical protein